MITDPLDRLLAAAAAPADVATTITELDDAFDDMAMRIKGSSLRWQLRRRRVITAAVAVSVSLAAPAAASWVGARTGLFGAVGMTENDGTEWLRKESPEMAAAIDRQGRDYPLPPGGTFAGVVDRLGRNPGLIQDSGVRMMVAWESVCQWERLWLSADDMGQADMKHHAGSVLQDAATWPIFTLHDGGGVVQSRAEVGSAAIEGRRGPVEQDFRANCPDRVAPAGR